MFELMLAFVFFNIILNIKRIPLFGFIFGIFTFFIAIFEFLNSVEIPANPTISVFVALLGAVTVLLNALDYRGNN